VVALYDNIVTVIEGYLGPAGQRFVDRQIESHLQKSPTEITVSDLAQLTDWIRVSLSLITDDRQIVEECVDKLHQLC
jgi:hypothetical protein